MGLPPTSSKISSDSNEVTTFKFDFPNFTGNHTGTDLSLGINSVAGGGTGLATLTANNVILGNGASSPIFVAPGTTGNVLTSNGITWQSSAASAGNPFDLFYSSAQSTNYSTNNTTPTTVTTALLSFTPNYTAIYKVHAILPTEVNNPTYGAYFQITNTSGGASQLTNSAAFQGINNSGVINTSYIEALYTLVSGTAYVFNVQIYASSGSATATLAGSSLTWYAYAERCG
jgi:hypothetical protein